MTEDFKLTDRQKVELEKMMSGVSGKLELIVMFKDKEMTSLSDNATFNTMTNVITELTERLVAIMKEAMEKIGITEEILRSSLSSEQLQYYTQCKFPMALKVSYLGEDMIMARQNILPHQMLQAFESMSLTIQRGIDNAKNGIMESNMVKVKDFKST